MLVMVQAVAEVPLQALAAFYQQEEAAEAAGQWVILLPLPYAMQQVVKMAAPPQL